MPMKKNLFILLLHLAAICCYGQQTYPSNLTVAADGSGDYRTIQEAINAVRAYSPVPLTIYIKNGVYKEKIVVPSWVENLTIIGESRENTIITNDDYSGKYIAKGADTMQNKAKFTTFTTYTMWVQGDDVKIRNLTIRNTAGRVGQAVALHVDGDRFSIENCNLLGNQDTLLTAGDGSRQYYLNCYIEGTTDFIFGPATAVFSNCTIKSLSNSYITAASTPVWKKFGYVFFNCKLIAAPEATSVYLGRPWRAYARTVFIDCEMDKHIRPEGWDNWRNPENEKTAYYAEYKSKGPGGDVAKRVSWSHQLTATEAKQYTLENIFTREQGWIPQSARDTSFGIQTTYEKEVKKFPFITIAAPAAKRIMGHKMDITYRRLRDRELKLDVFYPAFDKSRRAPAVLMIHGGGWRSGDRSHNNAMATELANNGYVAVTAEYRLSLEAKYPAAVTDLKAAVRWMRAHANEFNIDTSRIAVLGCSAGGQLAALLGTTNGIARLEDRGENANFSSNVNAVVNMDGILAFKHPESAEGLVAAQWLGGTYEESPDTWEDASALKHVSRNSVPILFINSSLPRFHAGRDDMIRKLNSYGIYSEVHELPDTPHPFWFFHPWFEPAMKYTVEFLDKIFKKSQY